MNLGDYMLYIWLGVIIALLLTEIISKNLVAACFGVSAFISLISTFFTNNYIIQVSLFLIIGILLIMFIRPNIEEIYNSKIINNKFLKDNKKNNKEKISKKNKKSTKK